MSRHSTKLKRRGTATPKTAIIASIAGDFLVAATKLTASVLTNSSAMMSEAIHSLVDTGNGFLMLYGIRQSRKPADECHQFGYGRELYFWSLMVAVGVFAVGGGVSIYEGVLRLSRPVAIENPQWNYAVLAVSFVFESTSWYFGWQAFRPTKKNKTIFQTVRTSKDPTTFTVLLEDSIAVAGLLIAFFGIFLENLFDIQYFDGLASILIGLLLCLVALVMGYETKELIIGETVDEETLKGIRQIVESEPHVEEILNVRTTHIGPNDVALGLELRYAKGASAAEVNRAIRRIEKNVRAEYPIVKSVLYAPGSLSEN
ncbi:MAG TPA: cation diffusion facilitator family transporter [Pyrinomonadaceae bacterium]|jgi:cation diffusion facilitator family transporter